ncbi:hypothetical protein GCM10020331_099100 [Ectobacillus funiculus]
MLLDYKEENPKKKYWEIMNKLFNKETGAGLTHVKVEVGADVNSSSGTEPATMRYADEMNQQMCSEEQGSNLPLMPNLSTQISWSKFLRWGEPRFFHGVVLQVINTRIDINGINRQSMQFIRSMTLN